MRAALPTKMADESSLRRMDKAGATITSTNQLIAELAQTWVIVNCVKAACTLKI